MSIKLRKMLFYYFTKALLINLNQPLLIQYLEQSSYQHKHLRNSRHLPTSTLKSVIFFPTMKQNKHGFRSLYSKTLIVSKDNLFEMSVNLSLECFAAAGGSCRCTFAAKSSSRQRAGAATPHGIV